MNRTDRKLTLKQLLAAVFLGALLLLTMAAAVSAAEVTVNTKGSQPPITVIADKADMGVWRNGRDIAPYKDKSKYYLFLPSSADLNAVRLRYDGELQFYDDASGILYEPGDTVTLTLKEGANELYEYDAAEQAYNVYTVIVMQASEIPTLYIDLNGGNKALININSHHSAEEAGHLLMTDAEGRAIYNGEMDKLKGHGNTSYEGSGKANTKNSYNMNIGSKAELVEGAGASKKWTLLRIRQNGEYDATGMSYMCAFWTYNALIKDNYFNQCTEYVNLYINGEFRGIYIIAERMDMGGSIQITDQEDAATGYGGQRTVNYKKNSSDPALAAGIQAYSYSDNAFIEDRNADITGGYVLEVKCGYYDTYGFRTKKGLYFNVKSPSNPTKEQVQYIAEYVQQFENALFSDTGYNAAGKHFTEYADMRSFAAQTLAYTFYLNWEIYRTSTYLYKDADGTENEKLTFGPIWDFESGPTVMNDKTIFGLHFGYDVEQQYTWFQQAWKKGDYLHLISDMNLEMQTILRQMLDIEEGDRIFRFTELGEKVRASQEMNWIRWKSPDSYTKRLNQMEDGMRTRYTTWYGTLWNEKNMLLGLTAEAKDNGDGTLTLTATTYGKTNSEITWYQLNESDRTKGTEIGTGDSIVVQKSGHYYASVTGPNNAYYSGAVGKVFKNKNLTVISNIIDADHPDLPVMSASLPWNEEPKAETLASPSSRREKKNAAAEESPAEMTARTATRYTSAEWTVFSVVIILCSIAVIVFQLKGKSEGGKKNA